MALLAHVVAAIESGIDRQTWRNPGTGDARWLRFLADIEQQIIDHTSQATGNTAEAEPGATT